MRVLLVEDDGDYRMLLGEALTQRGVEVVAVASLAEARAALALGKFDAIIADLHLNDAQGEAVVEGLEGSLPIIFVSGAEQTMTKHVCLLKPIPVDEVLRAVNDALIPTQPRVAGA